MSNFALSFETYILLMQKIFSSLMAICFFVCFSTKTMAQTSQQSDNASKTEAVYMFGISQSLKDSLVFISDIHEVKGATLDKQNFLQYRERYTRQFRQYVETSQQRPNQTTAVFFAKSFKTLNKKLAKAIKRFDGQKVGAIKQKVIVISKDQFIFQREPGMP